MEIGGMRRLRTMGFDRTLISGTLPSGIGEAHELRVLQVDRTSRDQSRDQ